MKGWDAVVGRAVICCFLAFPSPGTGQGLPAPSTLQKARLFHHSAVTGLQEAYLDGLSISSHAANLLLLRNGDLLCFWFSGTRGGASGVAIVYSRLPKGSRQWSKTKEIDHQHGRSYQNPVAFQAANGRVWLFHSSQPAAEWQAHAEVLSLTSDDNGETWRGPMPVFTKPGSFVRQPVLRLSRSHWLLPMYYTPSRSITDGAEANYSAIKQTRDGGGTWRECEVPHSGGLVQPDVLRLPSGFFLAFFRSRFADFIYQSRSLDGCQWAAPSPTHLPNNNSSIQAVLLKNGDIVMAFNNTSPTIKRERPQAGLRTPLTLAISQDGGKTWPWLRDLEARDLGGDTSPQWYKNNQPEEYSYPSIIQDGAGTITVAYTYRRRQIKVVRLEEGWIKQGGTIGRFRGDPLQ